MKLKPIPEHHNLVDLVRVALPHIEVQDHPYDIGYWARRAGFEKPKEKQEAEGWKDADEEMSEEAKP